MVQLFQSKENEIVKQANVTEKYVQDVIVPLLNDTEKPENVVTAIAVMVTNICVYFIVVKDNASYKDLIKIL